ncbi:uncharacterized protein BDZ99DRAFT_481312 [Mytilinidion resinicola]|uniref:Uncharacterized protein n=1 Tax=Mytilinidion resinicola TaxID=574789 RepID=A0A6A6Y5K8_9PEZI|nr:uncharacterized protein BDZ99DRAFT_481312 [Mytilinidion resinicola]KAF2804131.1 hypothetical protein BDZ99DRAFT_481312 [Mytilinidion resinicola]
MAMDEEEDKALQWLRRVSQPAPRGDSTVLAIEAMLRLAELGQQASLRRGVLMTSASADSGLPSSLAAQDGESTGERSHRNSTVTDQTSRGSNTPTGLSRSGAVENVTKAATDDMDENDEGGRLVRHIRRPRDGSELPPTSPPTPKRLQKEDKRQYIPSQLGKASLETNKSTAPKDTASKVKAEDV